MCFNWNYKLPIKIEAFARKHAHFPTLFDAGHASYAQYSRQAIKIAKKGHYLIGSLGEQREGERERENWIIPSTPRSTRPGSTPARGRTNCRCAWQGDNFASVERATRRCTPQRQQQRQQQQVGCSTAGRAGRLSGGRTGGLRGRHFGEK